MLFRGRCGRKPSDSFSPQKFYLGHFRGDPMRNIGDRAYYDKPYTEHDVLERHYKQNRLRGRHFWKHSLHLPAQPDQSAIYQNCDQTHSLHRVLKRKQISCVNLFGKKFNNSLKRYKIIRFLLFFFFFNKLKDAFTYLPSSNVGNPSTKWSLKDETKFESVAS